MGVKGYVPRPQSESRCLRFSAPGGRSFPEHSFHAFDDSGDLFDSFHDPPSPTGEAPGGQGRFERDAQRFDQGRLTRPFVTKRSDQPNEHLPSISFTSLHSITCHIDHEQWSKAAPHPCSTVQQRSCMMFLEVVNLAASILTIGLSLRILPLHTMSYPLKT